MNKDISGSNKQMFFNIGKRNILVRQKFFEQSLFFSYK